MKRIGIVGIITVLMIVFSSCGRETKQSPSEVPTAVTPTAGVVSEPATVTVTPTEAVTKAPTEAPTQWPTPTLVPPEGRTSDSIRVALMFGVFISEEENAEINRILKEKGLGCEVEFVPDSYWYMGDQWEAWITEYASEFDIACIGTRNTCSYPRIREFSKKTFLPLGDYLETEEGSILKSTYSADAWKGTETDGEIYAVPNLTRNRKSGFIAVRDEYVSYFTDFDGTYMTLRNIYDRIGNEELRMVVDVMPDDTRILMLSGYTVLCGTLYDEKTGTCASPEEFTKRLYEVCSLLHQDLSNGVLINKAFEKEVSAEVPEDALAYIYYGTETPMEGYTLFPLPAAAQGMDNPGAYGVLASCPRKELALQALTLCFSDPRIASILCRKSTFVDWDWDAETELWKEQQKIAMNDEPGRFAGFRPKFSEEEMQSIEYLYQCLQLIGDRMYLSNASRIWFNTDYTPKQDDIQKAKAAEKFVPGVEAMNRELKKYFEENGN